jgi:acyl carrier protein
VNGTRNRVYDILARQFLTAKEDLTDETGPGDIPAWNSLGQLQIILEIERQFNIHFSVDDVMSFNNIGELIGLVEEYLTTGEDRTL